MSRHFTAGLAAQEYTTITRDRTLPLAGKIEVEVGQSVTGNQRVASAQLPGELILLRLPERMGLQTFEVLNGLKVATGESVEKGQLLCSHEGLFGLLKTTFESPVTGVVEHITERTGHMGIRLPSIPIDLHAYVDGTVVETDKSTTVKIESHAAFVQGIFGVGGERYGTLHALDVEGATAIDGSHIPANCKGAILFGGTNPSVEALQLAAERGAVGLITGSIDDKALAGYLGYDLGIALTGDEEVPMTVVITEGFGNMAISERVIGLIGPHAGKSASINGATQVRAGAVRPEIIVAREPLSAATSTTTSGGLEVGGKVRVIRAPLFGEVGEVIELPAEPKELPTGAFTRVVNVKLDSGSIATVPRANVEVL